MKPLAYAFYPLFLTSLFFAGSLYGQSEKPSQEMAVLVVTVTAKIENSAHAVQWEQTMEQVTIPGKPVSFKLDGEGLKLRALFTPYQTSEDLFMLVAQAQVYLSNEDRKNLQSSFQTLSCKLGEKVLFYPLGKVQDPDDTEFHTLVLEIMIKTLNTDQDAAKLGL